MCERTCPNCGSTEHFEGDGITGHYIACAKCGLILAHRFDAEAAPIDCTDPQQYARERSGVLPGAEAKDPADDLIFAI